MKRRTFFKQAGAVVPLFGILGFSLPKIPKWRKLEVFRNGELESEGQVLESIARNPKEIVLLPRCFAMGWEPTQMIVRNDKITINIDSYHLDRWSSIDYEPLGSN